MNGVRVVIFPDKKDATKLLNSLKRVLEKYGSVYLDDYNDRAGLPSENGTSDVYGWKNLDDAKVVEVPNGYLVELPRPKPIDLN